jgi:hypothetical protein
MDGPTKPDKIGGDGQEREDWWRQGSNDDDETGYYTDVRIEKE